MPEPVTAEELHQRVKATVHRRYSGMITPGALEAWLLRAGYAERVPGGLLVPTQQGVEVAGALNWIGRDTGRGR